MIDERIKAIDKAKKLKELAVRGEPGERDNAKTMLDAHKAKHNITDDDISGHRYSDDFVANFSGMSNSDYLNAIINKLANDKELQRSIMRLASAIADVMFKPR